VTTTAEIFGLFGNKKVSLFRLADFGLNE